MKLINKYIVDEEHVNMRLDKFVRKYSSEKSLSLLFSLIRKSKIKVNDKKSKENYRLNLGDIIEFPEEAKISINKNYLKKIDTSKFKEYIVFEDENIFVVNKPDKLPMHKGNGHNYGLSEIAKAYYNNSNVNFANRLDRDTSGLVIGTKNLSILREINNEIKEKKVLKKYIAKIKYDKFKLGYKFYNDKNLKIIDEKVIVSKDGLESYTDFEVIGIKDGFTILDVNLKTGRKHQIRVHLSDLGYPIVGDYKYGFKDKSNKLYLKCYRIKFLDYDIEIEKQF